MLSIQNFAMGLPRRLLGSLLFILLLNIGSNIGSGALAAELSAHDLVKSKTQAVMALLQEKQATFASDPKALYDLVQTEILPLVDFETMAKLSLGLPWRRATPEQRERFVAEFRTMLVRIYTTSLLEYVGATIEYLAPRDDDGGRDGYSKVYTKVIMGQGKAPVEVIYSLREKDGVWLAYDVSIEGVSLIKNYRTSFSRVVTEAGLDVLIERLATRNRELKVDTLGGPEDAS